MSDKVQKKNKKKLRRRNSAPAVLAPNTRLRLAGTPVTTDRADTEGESSRTPTISIVPDITRTDVQVQPKKQVRDPRSEKGTLNSLLMDTGPLDGLLKGEQNTWPKVAKNLYAAWQDGDRAAAAKVADSGTVTAIFAIDKSEGTDLQFAGCTKTGDTPLPKDCSFTRPGGELVVTVSAVDGKRTATAVKLGPAATTPTSTP